MLHVMHFDRPDVPEVDPPCCMGSAVYGPQRCTCWTSEFDGEQAEPDLTAGPAKPRETMCHDCAFRPSSPERSGDPRFQHSAPGEMEDLDASRHFYCHQGMRRRVAVVHPSGLRVAEEADGYAPAIAGGRCFKADGAPADLCAGWWARVQRDAEEDARAVEEERRSGFQP